MRNSNKSEETTKPTHIQVSDYFYRDAADLIKRFRLVTKDPDSSFVIIKSSRFKSFIDLRMATESILKAIVSLNVHSDLSGEKLVKRMEGYRHHLDKLMREAEPHIPPALLEFTKSYCSEISKLPVGLRYSLDGMSYLQAQEKHYYKTIGNDTWLYGLRDHLTAITEHIGKELNSHSRILSGKELLEVLQAPEFNKYKQPK